MVFNGGLFVLILSALVVRSSASRKRGCTPSGFKDFQPFITFREAEDTGLLGFYILYSPPRPKKVDTLRDAAKNEIVHNDSLIDCCVESHPGELL